MTIVRFSSAPGYFLLLAGVSPWSSWLVTLILLGRVVVGAEDKCPWEGLAKKVSIRAGSSLEISLVPAWSGFSVGLSKEAEKSSLKESGPQTTRNVSSEGGSIFGAFREPSSSGCDC